VHVVDRGIILHAGTVPPASRSDTDAGSHEALRPGSAQFCSFPSLARLDDGTLIVSFRAGSSKDSADEDTPVMSSKDGGRTWTTVFTGFGDMPPGRGRIRCLAVTSLGGGRLLGSLGWYDRTDPSLPLANPRTQGILPSRILVARSEDGGRTWPAVDEVPLLPHVGNAVTGSTLPLPDGRLALPYEAWKDYDDKSPGQHHAALRVSADGGTTWPELAIVAHDPAGRVLYWDQRLGSAPDAGRLIAMFWAHDREAQRDLPIHVAWGSPDAQQWTQPVSTGISGQICAPLPLGGDRVFAVYVHRHTPPTLRAILSDDFGRTWTAASELIFYEKHRGERESGMGGQRDFGDYWADMNIWTFGHPAPLLLPDGDVMVAFYAGDKSGMGIHWVRIRV
jgi:hypothetical protein